MAETSKIEWTNATWNPITGCTVLSPGCTNCYAMRLAGGRLRNHPSRAGLTQPSKAGPVWTGEVRFNEQWLDQPLRWRKPLRIFVCAHGDLFHEDVPDEWIDQVNAVISVCPQHDFQVLTKRAERMHDYWSDPDTPARIETFQWAFIEDKVDPLARRSDDIRATALDTDEPFPNLWVCVSVEDQDRANERIPWLLETPAAVRGVSLEPLLGPIDLTNISASRWPSDPPGPADASYVDSLRGERWYLRQGQRFGPDRVNRIDWVIVGGESGHGARPMHLDWARQLRDQCQAAGVPIFVKQLGSIWGHAVKVGRDTKGGDPSEWPADLRVREYPDG